jgi:hypothetical protein
VQLHQWPSRVLRKHRAVLFAGAFASFSSQESTFSEHMAMTIPRDRITHFFHAYESRTNAALAPPYDTEIDATVAAFTECFIAANPLGVSCGKNDGTFREAMVKGLEHYRAIGTKQMNIHGLVIADIDDSHALVRVQWSAFYRRKDGREITIPFSVSYALQLRDDVVRIFAFVTGDEQAEYAKHGLTPE